MNKSFSAAQTKRRAYELNPDTREGLEFSVRTSQPIMALQYAEILINQLLDRVEALENAGAGVVAEAPQVVKEAVAKASTTTPVKGRRTAAKAEPDSTEE